MTDYKLVISNPEVKHLFTMKTSSHQQLLTASIIVSYTLVVFFPALSAAEQQGNRAADWDMSFFSAHCPETVEIAPTHLQPSPQLNIFADETKTLSSDIVSFKGNVKFQYGAKVISADSAELNKSENVYRAKGDVRYVDPHLRLASDSIIFNFNQRTIETVHPKFQLINSGLRGEAAAISLYADQPLIITDVGITSCPPGDEIWLLQSSKIEIDHDNGRGVAQNVVLRINDFPVFYLPVMSFPIDDKRSSGFLYPSMGSSSRNGIELLVPWYWNIAQDKDATLTARFLSERGLMAGLEYRQLTQNSNSILFAEYLANDDKGIDEEDRFFFQLNTDYSSGEHWRANIDLSSVSDDSYFYDFGSNFNSVNRNYLKREARIGFNSQHLSFTAIMSNDQLLSAPEEPYSRLPQLRLSWLYPDAFSGLTVNFHMEATSFRHPEFVEAERLVLVPELSLPMHWLSGYIKPNLKMHYSQYSQDDPLGNLPDKISRSVPIFSVDSGMVFERAFDFAEQNFIQTFEPRLFYLYVPERQQDNIAIFDTTTLNNGVDSLFRENRYTGIDRIGDSNQLSWGVTSRFYERASGQERMRFSVGRAFYFEDRKVNFAIVQNGIPAIDLGIDKRSKSALITNLHLSLYDQWWFKGELEYDDSADRTEKGVLGLYYLSNGLALNIQHRVNRFNDIENIEQAELSFSWKVSDVLSFVGRWQQDLRQGQTIDSFAGFEYESCCWAIRLVARRYLNVRLDQKGVLVPGTNTFNKGLYLEFILKGLTNIGNRLKLESDIQGYEDRF